jgi:hypothetical protein
MLVMRERTSATQLEASEELGTPNHSMLSPFSSNNISLTNEFPVSSLSSLGVSLLF